mmetsp:Transcript_93145/g.114086  ORF Transcript_93145/g.114086 Transcript_93145/m.114086 type:complete len:134 (-) Transcript_93145:69-470(-)
MGNHKSKKQDPKKDKQALEDFLKGKGNLDKIWKQFDKDGNGTIDSDELKELIYASLCLFCQKRDPDMPTPKRSQCEPFVNKILADLKPVLDDNDDGVISRSEFERFGSYLVKEHEKLKLEIQRNGLKKKKPNQ